MNNKIYFTIITLFINVIFSDNIDANWMSYIPDISLIIYWILILFK